MGERSNHMEETVQGATKDGVCWGGGLRCSLSKEDEERGSMGEAAGARGFVKNPLDLPREPLYLGLSSSFFLQPMS